MDYISFLSNFALNGDADQFKQNIPSFFEALSSEEMTSLLPALYKTILVKVVGVLNHNVIKNPDLIAAIFSSFFETCCLKMHSALFSEYYYGFKRASLQSSPNKKTLNNAAILKTIGYMIWLPYFQKRLDQYYEEHLHSNIDSVTLDQASVEPSEEANIEPLNRFKISIQAFKTLLKSLRGKLVLLFWKGYPYFSTAMRLLQFIFNFLFLLGLSNYYSPYDRLFNIVFQRSLDEGIEIDPSANNERAPDSKWKLFVKSLRTHLFFICFKVWKVLKHLLPTGIYFLSYLRQADSAGLSTVISGNKKISPPPCFSAHPKGIRATRDKKCPLCHKERKNTTVLPSGYLFCYMCIFNYVKVHGRCPISLAVMDISDLRKIYEGVNE